MRKPKATELQLGILSRMADGWALGVSHANNSGGAWLQKNGIGRGGETISVMASTFRGLRNKGFIEVKRKGFPASEMQLTQAGREALTCKP